MDVKLFYINLQHQRFFAFILLRLNHKTPAKLLLALSEPELFDIVLLCADC